MGSAYGIRSFLILSVAGLLAAVLVGVAPAAAQTSPASGDHVQRDRRIPGHRGRLPTATPAVEACSRLRVRAGSAPRTGSPE